MVFVFCTNSLNIKLQIISSLSNSRSYYSPSFRHFVNWINIFDTLKIHCHVLKCNFFFYSSYFRLFTNVKKNMMHIVLHPILEVRSKIRMFQCIAKKIWRKRKIMILALLNVIFHSHSTPLYRNLWMKNHVLGVSRDNKKIQFC